MGSPSRTTSKALGTVARAIAENKVRVVYQPIVEVETGKTFAFEALARCSAKDLESPEKLFEAAVVQKACGKLGRILRELATDECPAHPLFLNVHPHELADRWLVQPNDPIFSHEPGVYLEVTESVPLTHRKLVEDVLREVRSKGVRLVVDDLGAGYSNLRYIADLVPHVVKLDRGLVESLDSDPRRQTLVGSIVRLCNDLGADVVAEGVETKLELEAVCEAGVKYVQGYLLAKPAHPAPHPARDLLPPSDGKKRGETKRRRSMTGKLSTRG
ncbi:MAG TPA: EAL domain-containing protein [Polyangiaceae bacterium]|nr:EAL domain-containing protein [Polyangiaceae bacterium]